MLFSINLFQLLGFGNLTCPYLGVKSLTVCDSLRDGNGTSVLWKGEMIFCALELSFGREVFLDGKESKLVLEYDCS